MARLGMLEEWLAATADPGAAPAVRFSSCFPWLDETLFVTPPRSVWPPAPSAKLRAKGARFIPLSLAASMLAEEPIAEDDWVVDGPSECLIPRDKQAGGGPYRVALRSNAAVDRLTGGQIELHHTACLEFTEKAGLWTVAIFENEEARSRWSERVEAAFRYLADSGFGGERSLGWGRSDSPEFTPGMFPELILPSPPRQNAGPADSTEAQPQPVWETAYWLLSLFSPAGSDSIDWQRGEYSFVTRGGRIESSAGWGTPKKLLRMVEEGSVLVAGSAPAGTVSNVAPDSFSHPVFRAGFAVAIPIPWRVTS